jgi:UDP-N-acetylmuramoyl-tripeptide--D-alanyl-D-alanine ligase
MMTLGDAALAIGARLDNGRAARTVLRVVTDSRTLQPGDLFVAIAGERFDGHAFVADALAAGAAGAVVARAKRGDYPGDAPLLAVRDTRLSLGQLARAWRARFTLPLIAVAGSNGKTTVTQMIASVLRAHSGPAAFHTQGNFNNDIGLPLTLLRLRGPHAIGVVELGMNHRGEIAYLAGIARPTIALVNNAQREHQEFLKSVEDVAAENASLFDFLPPDGIAIVNADDALATVFVDRAGGRRVVTFGLDHPADITGDAGQPGDAAFGSHLAIALPDGTADVALRIAGRHNAMNALAAAAACHAAGVPAATIARGLAAFTPVAGRLVKHMLGNGAIVLDDTYNANPDSVRAAIDVLAAIGGRRVLVLGRMGEVGEQGPAFHREVGAYARARGIDALATLGPEAREAAEEYGSSAVAIDDIAPLVDWTRDAAEPGTTILVKGSRSARMERVVRALTGQDEHPEDVH